MLNWLMAPNVVSMPSPIAHAAAGYALFKLYKRRQPFARVSAPGIRSFSLMFPIILALSLLPDLDFIPGILFEQVDQFHNGISHSLFSGLLVSLLLSVLVWLKQRSHFMYWFFLILLCYELHVIMDFFTVGRGAMIWWPFSSERYEPTIKLFYGLHRSDGIWSIRHIWTLVTELTFAAIVIILTNAVTGGKQKETELERTAVAEPESSCSSREANVDG